MSNKLIRFTNIIFLIIFGIFLIIPIFKFDNNKVSASENRTLALRPKIFKVTNIKYLKSKSILKNLNLNYFSDLDRYINDHFFMREKLVELYKNILYSCAIRYPHINQRFIDKKTKWLGRDYSPIIYKTTKKKSYRSFVNDIRKELINFNNYCKNNNAKFYVLIFPIKSLIYKPSVYNKDNNKDVKEFIKTINPTNEINIIFPLDELQKEAHGKNLMYYKTDHHPTGDGMYVGYQSLMKEIQKTYPDAVIIDKSEYYIKKSHYVKSGIFAPYTQGSHCRVANLTFKQCQKHLDYKYNYYVHKMQNKLKHQKIINTMLEMEVFHYDFAPYHKVLLIGNSQIEDLSNFLAFSFRDIYKIRLNGPSGINSKEQYKVLKYYKNIIEEFKPDIIILCIDYNSVENLNNLTILK